MEKEKVIELLNEFQLKFENVNIDDLIAARKRSGIKLIKIAYECDCCLASIYNFESGKVYNTSIMKYYLNLYHNYLKEDLIKKYMEE